MSVGYVDRYIGQIKEQRKKQPAPVIIEEEKE